MALHNDMTPHNESWPTLPSLPPLLGPTVPTIGHRFFIHSPSTILKLGTDDGEGIMTALAHSILGPCVPRVVSVVTISSIASNALTPTRAQQGLVLTQQPGMPLVELWPSLTTSQRQTVKAKLCHLLMHMRARHFAYSDDSRVRALHASAPDTERAVALERVQRGTTGVGGWNRPVLAHGDLSDRNILVDRHTLAVTGFLDWEMANIMPAYFEYIEARLSEGHQPE
ncbi:hypothetical protein AJ78_08224 [Emergomyces pasteurianus Ep9510]|uniref:Aminoglycoside phosphotransferase domain-containing protein n=1 Tax=Emergomyces pasteurianus Ep9510 TaxID=1447872 RepID=A0A1J9P4U7_9EURO|nr:hypothetical protein AJ78_08224 [Emergomyces pasteurianus Ep9510]